MSLQSENINELAAALAIAQGSIGTAGFDKVNPHYKSEYSSYDSIRKACQKPLCDNGLCITQMLSMTDRGRVLITQITHKSGQWIRSELMLPSAERETPQAIGSSITYAKRYALSALLCIGTGDDDDGERAEAEVIKHSAPVRRISQEEAEKIDSLIGDDEEYKESLLKYFSSKYQSSFDLFSEMPHTCLAPIMASIDRRNKKSPKNGDQT